MLPYTLSCHLLQLLHACRLCFVDHWRAYCRTSVELHDLHPMNFNLFQITFLLLLLTSTHATAPSSHTLLDSSRITAAEPTASSLPTRVIFDHDAGVDDFITLMLLLSQPSKVEVLVSRHELRKTGLAPKQKQHQQPVQQQTTHIKFTFKVKHA